MVIQHSSITYEHYTDTPVIDAIRELMGDIDLDPASCELAQERVKASAWYGPGSPMGQDGLCEPWMGRVYLNPPGGVLDKEEARVAGTTSRAALWWMRLAEAWESGEVEQAVFMGFSLEILRTVQSLDCVQPMHLPFCVPASRLAFGTNNRVYEKGRKKGKRIDPESELDTWVLQKQPAHANVIVYLPLQDHMKPGVRQEAEASFREIFSPLGQVRA